LESYHLLLFSGTLVSCIYRFIILLSSYMPLPSCTGSKY